MSDQRRSMTTRCLTAATTGVVIALAAGCSSPSLRAAEASTAYEPVLREVADAATTATKAQWVESSAGGVQAVGDGCTWFSRTLTSQTDLSNPPQWGPVVSATEEALRKHGFASATSSELKGGYTGVESGDERGARLTISAKGSTTLRITVPVSDGC
ncbi:hypothetical protein [Humibacillus sp. DSM 29435]|uniref:hypothetical protein n=1 Tax=Humibacillus sp. DSM 29435 TaxID=1869167 RepID=UPI00111303AC|nr:hypothetical protein [Humibacillus sp. DSM 29435]